MLPHPMAAHTHQAYHGGCRSHCPALIEGEIVRLFEGFTASGATRIHLPAHPVQRQVLGTPIPVGASLAKIGNRRHEQTCIDRAQIRIVEPECGHHAWVKIFDHHIRFGHEPHEQLPATQQFEIERDALLVGIEVQEEPALFWMRHIIWKGAEPSARVAPVRALDFDHARPIVGQELGTVGASNVMRQIEHQHIVEGLGWHRLATFCGYDVMHCLPGDAPPDKLTRGRYHNTEI